MQVEMYALSSFSLRPAGRNHATRCISKRCCAVNDKLITILTKHVIYNAFEGCFHEKIHTTKREKQ